jgi:hypothetical protein
MASCRADQSTKSRLETDILILLTLFPIIGEVTCNYYEETLRETTLALQIKTAGYR